MYGIVTKNSDWLSAVVTTPTDVVNQRAHVFERPCGSNGCFPGMS